MITDSSRIIVLCTGNSCRSQMAHGFLRHYLRSLGLSRAAASVCSAGLKPHGLNPRAVTVMAEVGIDISGHRSADLKEYLADEFSHIITVCDNAAERCPILPGKGERLHWSLPDPAKASGSDEAVMSMFRTVRDAIDMRVREWLGAVP